MAISQSPFLAAAQTRFVALQQSLGAVLRGKPQAIELSLIGLLAGGHILLTDLPGVGKTLLGLALAHSIDAPFRRIQFTNDTLPSDILGTVVYVRSEERFRFTPGPIFGGVVLADEINRASPKTQSALLEAMTERQVSVENETYPLPAPFFVIATQNPQDFHGTFPLPESQLDRFLLRFKIGYPELADERDILAQDIEASSAAALPILITAQEIVALRGALRQIVVEASVTDYLLALVRTTRQDDAFAHRSQSARRPGAQACRPGPRLPAGALLRFTRRHQGPGRAGSGASPASTRRGRRRGCGRGPLRICSPGCPCRFEHARPNSAHPQLPPGLARRRPARYRAGLGRALAAADQPHQNRLGLLPLPGHHRPAGLLDRQQPALSALRGDVGLLPDLRFSLRGQRRQP